MISLFCLALKLIEVIFSFAVLATDLFIIKYQYGEKLLIKINAAGELVITATNIATPISV